VNRNTIQKRTRNEYT